MRKKFYEEATGRLQAPEKKDTYDYPTMESSDKAIERFIEKKRCEFYREWFCYVKDFE